MSRVRVTDNPAKHPGTQARANETAQRQIRNLSVNATLVVAGPVSDDSFPSPPPDTTRGFDSVALQEYIKIDGVWRKSAAYT